MTRYRFRLECIPPEPSGLPYHWSQTPWHDAETKRFEGAGYNHQRYVTLDRGKTRIERRRLVLVGEFESPLDVTRVVAIPIDVAQWTIWNVYGAGDDRSPLVGVKLTLTEIRPRDTNRP